MAKKNIKLEISYKGTHYHGFQRQEGQRTVQASLEEALSKNLGEDIRLTASGRTDAGVHAICQVVNFKSSTIIQTRKIPRLVNYDLPDDISILSAVEVDMDFHSRFLAKSRTYKYNIYRGPNPSAFYQDISWHIGQDLDIERMEEGASKLLGLRDFSAFSGRNACHKSPFRRLYSIDFMENGDLLEIHLRASSFLKNMARIIVASLVDLGRGRLEAKDLVLALESKDRSYLSLTAPAKGLILMEVAYD